MFSVDQSVKFVKIDASQALLSVWEDSGTWQLHITVWIPCNDGPDTSAGLQVEAGSRACLRSAQQSDNLHSLT